ncbi:hypothetical protein MMC13_006324 [Lambiella insularis]|nr:hypothetical protein [Lambiella insularis]
MCRWEEDTQPPSPSGRSATGRLIFQPCKISDLPDFVPCPVDTARIQHMTSDEGVEERLLETCKQEDEDAELRAVFKFADELKQMAKSAGLNGKAAYEHFRRAETAALSLMLAQMERRTRHEAGVRDRVHKAVALGSGNWPVKETVRRSVWRRGSGRLVQLDMLD